MPAQHPKTPRPQISESDALAVWIGSWDLSLRADGRSVRTRDGYRESMALFIGWLRRNYRDVEDWDQVTKVHLRAVLAWAQEPGSPCPHLLVDGTPAARCGGYGLGTVRSLVVSLQQFFAWWASEEGLPDPMRDVKGPKQQKLGQSNVPVLSHEDMAALIKDAERERDFHSLRDAAILRLFQCTPGRLAEVAGMGLRDFDRDDREIHVVGKGARPRTMKITEKATVVVDRYLRARIKLKGAPTGPHAPLWLGRRRGEGYTALTAKGIYLLIRRRAERCGVTVHPHMFRHSFAHNWLDLGGAEGDLMELAGWESPQMLRHYGASARGARARRAYDRIDVTGGY